jgi:hypothetical protein
VRLSQPFSFEESLEQFVTKRTAALSDFQEPAVEHAGGMSDCQAMRRERGFDHPPNVPDRYTPAKPMAHRSCNSPQRNADSCSGNSFSTPMPDEGLE